MKAEPKTGLSREARRKWREIQQEYNIVDGQGILLLDTMFSAYDQITEAERILELEGYVVETETTGTKRAHPAAAILKEARNSYLKALAMLNLDVVETGPIGRPPGK